MQAAGATAAPNAVAGPSRFACSSFASTSRSHRRGERRRLYGSSSAILPVQQVRQRALLQVKGCPYQCESRVFVEPRCLRPLLFARLLYCPVSLPAALRS